MSAPARILGARRAGGLAHTLDAGSGGGASLHEMGIALSIVEAVTDKADGARVRRVSIEVGKLAAVLPDALRFCFDLACEGTTAAGAVLEILEVPGLARCRECQAEVELDRPFGRCACGNTHLDWLSGEQLRIRDMDVL